MNAQVFLAMVAMPDGRKMPVRVEGESDSAFSARVVVSLKHLARAVADYYQPATKPELRAIGRLARELADCMQRTEEKLGAEIDALEAAAKAGRS